VVNRVGATTVPMTTSTLKIPKLTGEGTPSWKSEPTAHVHAPRSSTSLSVLNEATTNAYLTPPAGLLPMLTSKTVPINLTVGTSNDASYAFTADWSQLAIGMRTGFNIRFLDQRYVADTLSYAWLAYLRADVQLFQPAAFNVDQGVRA
jgi:hypothetical protein